MNSVLFVSGCGIYVSDNAGFKEISPRRIIKYREALRSIQSRHAWKTTGAGAAFAGVADTLGEEQQIDDSSCRVTGIAPCGAEIAYACESGDLYGIYIRGTNPDDDIERHVAANTDARIGRIALHGISCAAGIGMGAQRHMAFFDIETGNCRELTEGDVCEDYPAFTPDGKAIIYSSAGLAYVAGRPPVKGPYAVYRYDIGQNRLDCIYACDTHDCVCAKPAGDGAVYFLKRPYGNRISPLGALRDVALFPVRILKGIIGFLNSFSILFGGEAVKSRRGGDSQRAKRKSEKELFFEGNIINAEETLRNNEKKGEKYPGIIPRSWELCVIEAGSIKCIKKGVMDFCLCADGSIAYSNGRAVVQIEKDGTETLLCKSRLAFSLCEMRTQDEKTEAEQY